MCPHTAVYVSSYCYVCVLMLLYMCLHTAIYVSLYCYIVCPSVCVLILLYMCPHTRTSTYCIATCSWREVQPSSPGPGCRLDARMLRVGRSIVLYGGSNGHAALGIYRLYICVLMLGLRGAGSVCVSSYCCILVLILLDICPLTTRYVSSYCYMCVFILLYVSSCCYICFCILAYMCPRTAIYVSL